ncbi:hypothetical protein MKW98_013984 [Papaver atlanticum]|uniref:Uncharacterized protein n=1 Tax=Papaver atlanticum TaxID=357466 RepID=A0AAD4XG28_9MAGN|nr:hypothetical protein MKW98_013984 [Papaver atlanticum]
MTPNILPPRGSSVWFPNSGERRKINRIVHLPTFKKALFVKTHSPSATFKRRILISFKISLLDSFIFFNRFVI